MINIGFVSVQFTSCKIVILLWLNFGYATLVTSKWDPVTAMLEMDSVFSVSSVTLNSCICYVWCQMPTTKQATVKLYKLLVSCGSIYNNIHKCILFCG